MTPKTSDILLNNIEEVTEQTSKTYYLNIEKNTISNLCTWSNGSMVCFPNRSGRRLLSYFKYFSRFIQWSCLVGKPE